MSRPKYGPRFAVPSYTVKPRGESGCMLTGSPASVVSQVACYLESRPAGVIDVTYSEQCGACKGSGRTLTSRRTLAWKPCKACGGQPELVPDTLLSSHTNPSRSV